MNPYLYNQSDFIINLDEDTYVVNKNSIIFKNNIKNKKKGNLKRFII